uniref:Ribonuclease H-like domain-containing protein n=1 Tax=Tanacetum cinerariifolium TaxID=118510 RepID=A0A699H252_TANCI|nr:ribonuclease H-like domain-containing protein [Tanacetum cinerariifolium]
MYTVDLKNIVPKGGLNCFFAKATSDESKLWHKRLGHLNFKTMNTLVKGNLVRGLSSKLFENVETYVASHKGKQHRASCKTKTENSAEAINTACYVQNKVLVVKPLEYSIVKKIVEENLHIRFSENTPNVVGTKACDNAGQARKEKVHVRDYILLPLWTVDPPFSQDPKSSQNNGFQPSSDSRKKVDEDPNISTFNFSSDHEDNDKEADMNNIDTTVQVSHVPTTRIHKDHLLDQVIFLFDPNVWWILLLKLVKV